MLGFDDFVPEPTAFLNTKTLRREGTKSLPCRAAVLAVDLCVTLRLRAFVLKERSVSGSIDSDLFGRLGASARSLAVCSVPPDPIVFSLYTTLSRQGGCFVVSIATALKKNPLIAASIALPVTLVVVFLLAGTIPRLLVDPPGYDLVLTHSDWRVARNRPLSAEIFVHDERVVARVSRLEGRGLAPVPRVYLFDHGVGAVRELSIDWPDDLEAVEEGDMLAISELANATVSTSLMAPDGYVYRGSERRGGLFLGLFVGGRSDHSVTIGKGGAVMPIDLPVASGFRYSQVQFVGWVLK